MVLSGQDLFFTQGSNIEQLNLSGITLSFAQDLFELNNLDSLTHLLLNDIEFSDEFVNQFDVQQNIVDILRNNRRITHLGLNGVLNFSDQFANDSFQLFDAILPRVVSLELSDIGLEFLPFPLDQYTQLEVLDLSDNPLVLSGQDLFFRPDSNIEQLLSLIHI